MVRYFARPIAFLIAFTCGGLAAVTITGVSAELDLPWSFSNGSPADAEQINENFEALLNEALENRQRIAALESALLPDGAITTARIADSAIDTTKIADGSVTSDDIEDLSILDIDIVSLSAGKLVGPISESQLPQGAIDSTEIQNGSITQQDLATNSVSTQQIINSTITGADIENNSITSADIASNTITTSEIASGGVASSEIADNSIAGRDLNSSIFNIDSRVTSAATGIATDVRRVLGSSSSRLCFLAGMSAEEVDSSLEFASCQVLVSGGSWVLDSDVRAGEDNRVSCTAQCFSW